MWTSSEQIDIDHPRQYVARGHANPDRDLHHLIKPILIWGRNGLLVADAQFARSSGSPGSA